jgi:hypothetical protein
MLVPLQWATRFPVKGLAPLLLAAVVSQVHADPWDSPPYGADGVADYRSFTWSGSGNQSANLSAVGGTGATGMLRGGNGGAAGAVLDLTAEWQAAGSVSAHGGHGGVPDPDNIYYGMFGTAGDAEASAVLRGAGAVGSATATGGDYRNYNPGVMTAGSGRSSLTALTTGGLAVDVAAGAYSGSGGGTSTASLYVDSGWSRPAAGSASVTGNATAVSNWGYSTGDSTATLTLYGTGKLTGASLARSEDAANDPYTGGGSAGSASSSALGITRGKHDVTLSATASSGNALFYGAGNATASAMGQSGSGNVVVSANADAHLTLHQNSSANALANARTTDFGGSSTAYATAVGDTAAARAVASSVGGASTAVAVGQGLSGTVSAESSTIDSGTRALSASVSSGLQDNAQFTANAQAAFGTNLALPTFGNGSMGWAVVAAGGASGLGGGMQAAATDSFWGPITLRGQHTWDATAGQHLWINLLGTTASSTDAFNLDFSISNNGAVLYSNSFGSQDEANVFFSNHILDLGLLGAGTQNLVINSTLTVYGGGYGFNYILAVPEPLEWLLMLSGLTLVMTAARRNARRSQARLRAPDLLHAEAG